MLGAVSPPGGDFSEPVTTYTLRFIGTFWALDSSLAQRRHFPAINWLRSFTRYLEISAEWWSQYDKDWLSNRAKAMSILEEAAQIEETARIIGEKSLPDDQRLVLLVAELLREGFLVQAAYHEIDTYCEAEKQTKLLRIIIEFNKMVEGLVKQSVPIEKVRELPIVTEIMRLKERKGSESIDLARQELVKQVGELAKTYGVS
jgi:V/A-type H+-transporting ATPase subunit A